MKSVLIATFSTPGYAPNELYTYLSKSTNYDVQKVVLPAKHERKYVLAYSHIQNYRNTISTVKEAGQKFDFGIAPDPAFTFALARLRDQGFIEKVIYWRLDYYPKYHGLINPLYQKVERKALEVADEVWSVSNPELQYVAENLYDVIHKVRYVPYLLHQNKVQERVDPNDRVNAALWMGPDLDNSRPLCAEAADKANIPFTIADYSIDRYRLNDESLEHALKTVKVGLAVYRPEPKSSKYYADVSRIRRFLAYGIPVITTPVAPTYKTIREENCGYICIFDTLNIAGGIRYCLSNFEELSENAYKAAEKYTFERWFSDNNLF